MRNQRGMSLVEMMITSAMVLVVILSVTNSLKMASNFLNNVRGKRNRDRVISSTLSNVIQNVALYQKNYDLSEDQKNAMLVQNQLPIAWDQNTVVEVSKCPECPGRMGFIV